jgi:hypothetical protein
MPTTLPARSRVLTGITFAGRDDAGNRALNHDLIAILAFCAIGLLITMNVMLRYPDLGALAELYSQF